MLARHGKLFAIVPGFGRDSKKRAVLSRFAKDVSKNGFP
jgi:hypothetical protein